ncbi:uncharacterized protein [Nicotiana sylvestris]|uniref:uncharacterized protein n=1 Tax=Nicotiana sylvestris TaxID=4096 RepID=UPI00388C82E1
MTPLLEEIGGLAGLVWETPGLLMPENCTCKGFLKMMGLKKNAELVCLKESYIPFDYLYASMIEDSGLVDLGYYGHKYIWSNGRGPNSIVCNRLDRGLVNGQGLTVFPATTVSHLVSAGSDHNPLLMEINLRQETGKRYFKFLICLVKNDKFMPLVEEKTQLQWFKEGDEHSRYFHSLMKIKDEEGNWVQSDEAIGQAACDYSQELFYDLGVIIREDIFSCIPTMITPEDKNALSTYPTMN